MNLSRVIKPENRPRRNDPAAMTPAEAFAPGPDALVSLRAGRTGGGQDGPMADETGAGGREAGAEGGGIGRLLGIMALLRDPARGCPWDLVQDFASIAPHTLEEAHEVADAIARGEWGELKGELGDLLFQVVFHARIAEEAGLFAFDDVVAAICAKMIARHPHVFGDAPRDLTPEEQTRQWEALKARERDTMRAGEGGAREEGRGTLAGVALALPALTRAVKLQARAARVGFDWPDAGPVVEKLDEEAGELVAATRGTGRDSVFHELGDLLFTLVNLARHLGHDPEAALRAANARFTTRFARVEGWLAEEGRLPAQASLAEMEALWARAKVEEHAQPRPFASPENRDNLSK